MKRCLLRIPEGLRSKVEDTVTYSDRDSEGDVMMADDGATLTIHPIIDT